MPRKSEIENQEKQVIVIEQIEQAIYEIRGQRVMLDADLSKVYGVQTRILIRAVKRNIQRFPEGFVFSLSNQEVMSLRSQFGIANKGRGGRRTPPYAFTEHGAVMASTILNSPAAIDMSIHVIRAFLKARQFIEQHKELAQELKELRKQLGVKFSEYDEQFRIVFEAINQLIGPIEEKKRRKIGFCNR